MAVESFKKYNVRA